jgi:hypothetical protein
MLGALGYVASVFTAILATDFYGQAARGSTDQATVGNMAAGASIAAFLIGTALIASAFRRRATA